MLSLSLGNLVSLGGSATGGGFAATASVGGGFA